jgi:probable addiction module antidote protein
MRGNLGFPWPSVKLSLKTRGHPLPSDIAAYVIGATTMPTAATRPHDWARYLDSEDAIEEYLAAAFEEGDPKGIAHALGVIARARGMTQLSRDTGIAREALYRALSGEGNPEFATIMKVMAALGLRMTPALKRREVGKPVSSRRTSASPGRKVA